MRYVVQKCISRAKSNIARIYNITYIVYDTESTKEPFKSYISIKLSI